MLNKFNFLCLLVVSVELKLVMRNLVIEEIQGWNHHIVVCMVCAVLVAIIYTFFGRSLLIIAIKVQ